MAAAADGLWPNIRPADSLFVAAVALTAIAVSVLIDAAHPGRDRDGRSAARDRSHGLGHLAEHHPPAAARLRPCHAVRCRRRRRPRCGRSTGLGSWRCLPRSLHRPLIAAVAWRFDGTCVRACSARGDSRLHHVDLARDAGSGRSHARRDVRGEQPHRAVLRLAGPRPPRRCGAGRVVESSATPRLARRFASRRPAIPRRSRRTSSSSMRSRVALPSQFPGAGYDRSVDPLFRSARRQAATSCASRPTAARRG